MGHFSLTSLSQSKSLKSSLHEILLSLQLNGLGNRWKDRVSVEVVAHKDPRNHTKSRETLHTQKPRMDKFWKDDT
jgi:hypothetical protein